LRVSTGESQGRIHSKDGGLKNESHAHLKLMLELFGIPWINSPGEAEAQCARLEVSFLNG
jgi:5'-3' exonuclease